MRNVVWRVYSKLAELGALTIVQRKRAVVSSNADPSRASELVAVYDWLGRDFLDRIRAFRVNPQSFLRYLDHRLRAGSFQIRLGSTCASTSSPMKAHNKFATSSCLAGTSGFT